MTETELKDVPAGVRAFDREGREVIVPREVWLKDVLPGMIQGAWEQPDQLYLVVANSLNEGFVAQVTEAAAHLYSMDTVPARGACMWAAVLIRLERLVEAEMVLAGYLDRHGDNGPVLATLAQVYAAKGENSRAQSTLERANAAKAPEPGIRIGMVRVDGALWLPAASPARKLFGAKAEDAPTVTFMGGSAETPEDSDRDDPAAPGTPMSEDVARMTRLLPLFLAELAELRTAAAGRALLPWGVGERSGFVVSAQPWPAEAAVQAVQDPANRSEYVVTVHVDAEVVPWEATLKFIRAADGAQIGELSAEFAPDSPSEGLIGLAGETAQLLGALGEAEPANDYVVPEDLPGYLAALDSLLALRCVAMEGVQALSREREHEMLSQAFDLSAGEPENLPARLLLLETFSAAERVHPEPVAEFRERLERLAHES